MINVKQLCKDFEDCLGIPYVSPGDTGKNPSGIDCSGMFVRAYRLQNAGIAHGSNTIWRNYLKSKGKFTPPYADIKLGMAVFKWKSKDIKKYQDGQGDFHHIGLITSIQPLRIVHASSAKGKVVVDTKLDAWTHWGLLRDVQYIESEDKPVVESKVVSSNGLPVNLRKNTSTTSELLYKIPNGATVIVEQQNVAEGWSQVTYQRKTGYMMTKYLDKMNGMDTVTREEFDALSAKVDMLLKLLTENGGMP